MKSTSGLLIKLSSIFAMLFSSVIAFAQHGVGPSWGVEIPIPKINSNYSQRGVLFNNMVCANTGRIFIHTLEIDTTVNPPNGIVRGIYIYYSDNGGTNWSSPVVFTPAEKTIGASAPKITITNDGNVHFFWTAKVPAALFYSRYDYNLNLVIDTIRIANKVNYDQWATHLTIDKQDRLHAIWHEGNTDTNYTAEVYYSNSSDNGITWRPAQLLSNNDGKHSAFPRVQLDAARGDTIAIAWRDQVTSSNWDIQMRISTNFGANWNPVQTVVSGANYDSDPDVLIDNYGRIHLFFHQYPVGNPFYGANVRYAYSDNLGVMWVPNTFYQMSEPGKRSHLVEGTRYDISRNLLWTFWKDERDFINGQTRADMMCSYSTNRGTNWSNPEWVTDRDSFAIGYKAACLTYDGGVAVNYEVSSRTNGLGLLQVYFRKRENPLGITNINTTIPNDFMLYQNYPNPFNPNTKISFHLKNRSYVMLTIYDITGKVVQVLVNGQLAAGSYETEWAASGFSSGVYFYKLETNGFTDTKKMLMIK
jgi:hypothetical protein